MQFGRRTPRELGILRGKRSGCRQPLRDLFGKTRPGQHSVRHGITQFFVDNLMRQFAAAWLKALAHPDQRPQRAVSTHLAHRRTQAGKRSRNNGEVRIVKDGAKIVADMQGFRQGKSGKEAPIFAARLHVARQLGIAGPQGDLMPPTESNSQCRAPRPRGNDGQLQA